MISITYDKAGVPAGRGALNAFARSVVGHALRELDWADASLTVMFCSDARIRQLNRDFRQMDTPTDVLSFPASSFAESLRGEEQPYLGDLAIALPYTARQARAAGRPVGNEVGLLLVHGVLHLLGWDHDTKAREKKMWAKQDRLLAGALRTATPPTFLEDLGRE